MNCVFNNLINYICHFLNWIYQFFNYAVNHACEIVNFIWSAIVLISSKELSLELLAGELALLALYFVFLPIIVDRNSKEYYLGYNVYKWILYDRKSTKLFPDISFNWIISIMLILLGVWFYGYENYTLVTIIFFIYIIMISYKIIEYLILSSNDDVTHKAIEKRFLKDCLKDPKITSTMLIDNIGDDNNVFRKNIKFILEKYEQKGVADVFSNVYFSIMENNDELKHYILFEEIHFKIRETKYNFYFNVNPWDLYYFLKGNLKNNNEKNVSPIMFSIR